MNKQQAKTDIWSDELYQLYMHCVILYIFIWLTRVISDTVLECTYLIKCIKCYIALIAVNVVILKDKYEKVHLI